MIYDATCGVCATLVQVVDRFGRPGQIRLVPRLSEEGAQMVSAFWHEPASAPESVVVVSDGRALVESDAVLKICSQLVQPFPLLGIANVIPRRIRDGAYRLFARNRHRVSAAIGRARRRS